jgi:hypothetical protein
MKNIIVGYLNDACLSEKILRMGLNLVRPGRLFEYSWE